MFNPMSNMASPFNTKPPFLNEEKKPGPTCIPIEKMNKISPNSLMKWSTPESTESPKCPIKMPTNSTKVVPSDIPKNFTFPSITPKAITSEYTKIEWATEPPVNKSTIQSIFFWFFILIIMFSRLRKLAFCKFFTKLVLFSVFAQMLL